MSEAGVLGWGDLVAAALVGTERRGRHSPRTASRRRSRRGARRRRDRAGPRRRRPRRRPVPRRGVVAVGLSGGRPSARQAGADARPAGRCGGAQLSRAPPARAGTADDHRGFQVRAAPPGMVRRRGGGRLPAPARARAGGPRAARGPSRSGGGSAAAGALGPGSARSTNAGPGRRAAERRTAIRRRRPRGGRRRARRADGGGKRGRGRRPPRSFARLRRAAPAPALAFLEERWQRGARTFRAGACWRLRTGSRCETSPSRDGSRRSPQVGASGGGALPRAARHSRRAARMEARARHFSNPAPLWPGSSVSRCPRRTATPAISGRSGRSPVTCPPAATPAG